MFRSLALTCLLVLALVSGDIVWAAGGMGCSRLIFSYRYGQRGWLHHPHQY